MRSATRVLLVALAFAWAGSAAAQNDVTFQVDLNPYRATCQFVPQFNGVTVPGSMNGWNTAEFALSDGNNDGIYTGTFSLPAGPISFKYYVTGGGTLSWENDPNRDYTVVAGAQTVALSVFNGPTPQDACSATNQNYDLIFEVDMTIQLGRGVFRPNQGDIVGINGEVPNGWENSNPVPLVEDSFRPGVYGAILPRTTLAPSATGFKFVIRKADGTISWESALAQTPDQVGGNRVIRLTGQEPIFEGRRQFVYDNDNNPNTPVFFDDAGAADFLTGDAAVTFNVDMRPARYLILDAGSLPGNPPLTTFDRVAINGPAAGESNQDAGPGGGIGDWADWGNVLNSTEARQLLPVAGADDLWRITLNYSAGAKRNLVAKFGAQGEDNESGFGGDHRFPITEGAQTVNLSFGCIRQANGTFTASTNNGSFAFYQPYLRIDNSVPSCTVVRTGGGVGAEGGPQIAGLEISAPYPNPSTGVSRVLLTLDSATDVAVRVYDVTGRQVAVATEGFRAAGTSAVELDTRGLAAGLYVVRVEANGAVVSRRLTVAR